MADGLVPRVVTSVLVEESDGGVTVTWGLGDPVDAGDVEYFGYSVDYYGVDRNGGKRFAVRFHSKVTASVFDRSSSTQANYDGDCVTVTDEAIVVRYRDASIGLDEVGPIQAFSHVNGNDEQTKLPVTLLR